MKTLRRLILPFACLLGSLATPASALAAEEDFLYDPGTVNVIEIQLGPDQIKELEDEPREYVENGEVVLKKSDGTPAGVGGPSQTFKGVEVKLKGQPGGSFEDLDGKAAFKLKFKKKELFFGVRKLTLNNMTQDPSMVHESLAYTAFGAAGIPASRAGYAFVYLNGTNYGLHANVESLDVISLPKIFGAPFDEAKQHLYEAAEYGADFYPGKEPMFEVDEGKADTPADIADLTGAIAAVEANGPTELTTNLASSFDFAELTRMWGVEKYIGHWDGYAGEGIDGETEFNEHRPNNYYLYSDPTGRFSMLPWGTDQAWDVGDTGGVPMPFDGQDGRLFDFCLDDETCSGLFSSGVANALDEVGGLDLEGQAAATAAMLAPWQALEVAPRKPFSSTQVASAVTKTRKFIADRRAEAKAWLAAHPPPKGPEVIIDPVFDPPVDPPPAPPATPGTTTPPLETAEPGPGVLLLGFEKGDGVVRLRARAAHSGEAVLAGRSPLDGKLRRVCRDELRVTAPGREFTLVCRVSARALKRLGNHALPIDFRLAFSPDDAGGTLLTRRVTLPRQ